MRNELVRRVEQVEVRRKLNTPFSIGKSAKRVYTENMKESNRRKIDYKI